MHFRSDLSSSHGKWHEALSSVDALEKNVGVPMPTQFLGIVDSLLPGATTAFVLRRTRKIQEPLYHGMP